MKTIVVATGNEHKLVEMREIFSDINYRMISMKTAGISVDIEEDGTTYEENAQIKTHAVYKELCEGRFSREGLGCELSEVVVLSDDSGFEVDYLDKKPGVFSARFMGEDTPYSIKNQAIIDKLAGVPDEKRTARFCCAVSIILPNGEEHVVLETYEGRVAYEAKGTNGFGYDPIFLVPQYNKTDAELLPEVKNEIGHRGKAMRAVKKYLV